MADEHLSKLGTVLILWTVPGLGKEVSVTLTTQKTRQHSDDMAARASLEALRSKGELIVSAVGAAEDALFMTTVHNSHGATRLLGMTLTTTGPPGCTLMHFGS